MSHDFAIEFVRPGLGTLIKIYLKLIDDIDYDDDNDGIYDSDDDIDGDGDIDNPDSDSDGVRDSKDYDD